jgi:hypothetical protein
MGLLQTLIDRLGEPWALALAGLLIGLAFGFFAQRSRFCLRSAVIEFSRNLVGGKLTVWLFAFSTAVVATQVLALAGAFDASQARQIASARQPVGRGNRRRAVRHGHDPRTRVFQPAAGAGRSGQLALGDVGAGVCRHRAGFVDRRAGAAAEAIAAWWTVDGGASRDLIARTGIGHGGALVFGGVWLAAAIFWARRQKVPAWGWAGAMGVGLAITAAWWATYVSPAWPSTRTRFRRSVSPALRPKC